MVFIVPTVGYITYLIKTPWRFKIYKKYKISVTKIKILKLISIFLFFISIIAVMMISSDRNLQNFFNIEHPSNFLYFIAGVSLIISLIFLTFAMQITKKEREEIKQIKEFNLNFKDMINAKEPIMQQAVSMHTRNSDKYNAILKSEFNDIIEKVQSQFNFSPTIIDIIKIDTMEQLKSI